MGRYQWDDDVVVETEDNVAENIIGLIPAAGGRSKKSTAKSGKATQKGS